MTHYASKYPKASRPVRRDTPLLAQHSEWSRFPCRIATPCAYALGRGATQSRTSDSLVLPEARSNAGLRIPGRFQVRPGNDPGSVLQGLWLDRWLCTLDMGRCCPCLTLTGIVQHQELEMARRPLPSHLNRTRGSPPAAAADCQNSPSQFPGKPRSRRPNSAKLRNQLSSFAVSA